MRPNLWYKGIGAVVVLALLYLGYFNMFRVHGGKLGLVNESFELDVTAREAKRIYSGLDLLSAAKADEGDIMKYRLVIRKGSGERVYFFRRADQIKDASGQYYKIKGKGRQVLQEVMGIFHEKSPFGEPIPWSLADGLFPFDAVATVRDLETGLRFRVQRREGSAHADVQTITEADTAILKRAFGDKWTWKRRAVVVEAFGKRMAASMHGMPHGAGRIMGNNVDGHFCIHFLGSKTHIGDSVDLSHQLMVWKAAGMIEEKLAKAPPERVVAVLMEALNQGDVKVAEKLLILTAGKKDDLRKNLARLNWVSVSPYKFTVKKGARTAVKNVQFQVEMGLAGYGEVIKKEMVVAVEKRNTTIPWQVNYSTLNQLFSAEQKR